MAKEKRQCLQMASNSFSFIIIVPICLCDFVFVFVAYGVTIWYTIQSI